MNDPTQICLKFGAEIPAGVEARISYAFRVFAAIYNYRVVSGSNGSHLSDLVECMYSITRPPDIDSHVFWIPARYRSPSIGETPPSVAKHRHLDEDFYLLLGFDETTKKPDWLGEIFMWISSSLEMSIGERDSVGRIPYLEMVFNRQGISPRRPYAAMLMAWMENALRRMSGEEKVGDVLPRAPSPVNGTDHFVISSHDIDFYYTDKRSALLRLLKNLGISILTYRSLSFFQSSIRMIGEVIVGRRPGDYLLALLKAGEACEFQSTLFVVSQKRHRRDPSCGVSQLAPYLTKASRKSFCVGIHGSYTSVFEEESLASEVSTFVAATGTIPMGGRQHWLRFQSHERLFRAVENAGLLFDSSLGFSESVGFRNGANFAFPPYDFENEKPHEFLEIPLAIMDGGLESAARHGENPQKIADEVLGESRRWGWGGISTLWHNPIEPIQVPDSINGVFWDCLKRKDTFAEKWMAADKFIACSLSRYQNAGLLQNARIENDTRGVVSAMRSRQAKTM
jgi:hypothetical protein